MKVYADLCRATVAYRSALSQKILLDQYLRNLEHDHVVSKEDNLITQIPSSNFHLSFVAMRLYIIFPVTDLTIFSPRTL